MAVKKKAAKVVVPGKPLSVRVAYPSIPPELRPPPPVVIPPPDDDSGIVEMSRHTLRDMAGQHYVFNVNGTTLEAMMQHPLFGTVPRGTISKWAATDGWVEQRKEFLEKWQKVVEEKIGQKFVKERMRTVEVITRIRDRLVERLKGEDHEYVPGGLKDFGGSEPIPVCNQCQKTYTQHDPFFGVSGDKLVAALAKLVELEFSLSEVVLQHTFAPPLAGAEGAGAIGAGPRQLPRPVLTTEEAHAAAKAILDRRRKEMRAREAPPAAPQSGGAPPAGEPGPVPDAGAHRRGG